MPKVIFEDEINPSCFSQPVTIERLLGAAEGWNILETNPILHILQFRIVNKLVPITASLQNKKSVAGKPALIIIPYDADVWDNPGCCSHHDLIGVFWLKSKYSLGLRPESNRVADPELP